MRNCGRDSFREGKKSCLSQKLFALTVLLLGTSSPSYPVRTHTCPHMHAHTLLPSPLTQRNTQWKRCVFVCVQSGLSIRTGLGFFLL